MYEILICEKPEWVTYKDIYDLMNRAHEKNRENNVIVNSRIKNGEDIKNQVGEEAVCFVALDDEKLIGTVSVDLRKGKSRITKKKIVAHLMYLAVLPEYSGQHIGRRLIEKVEMYGIQRGVNAIELVVVERNPAKKLYEYLGYEPVDYLARKSLKQFSVIMIKWLKTPPKPRWIRRTYYILKRRYLRLRHRYK